MTEMQETFDTASFDSMPEGVYIVDVMRRIVYWNKASVTITGYSSEEVIGKSCFENILVHVDDEGRNVCIEGCPLFDTIRDGSERTMLLYLHHKYGHRVPVTVTAVARKTPNGKIIGAIEYFSIVPDCNIIDCDEDDISIDIDYCKDKLASCINELKKNNAIIGIISVTINNLSSIQQQYGEVTKSEMIKMTGRTLNANVKYGEYFGLCDSNEYVGIVQTNTEEELAQLTKKLAMLVEHSFFIRKGVSIHAELSVGSALVHSRDSVESMIVHAKQTEQHTTSDLSFYSTQPHRTFTDVKKEGIREKIKKHRFRKPDTDFSTTDFITSVKRYLIVLGVISFFIFWLWMLLK